MNITIETVIIINALYYARCDMPVCALNMQNKKRSLVYLYYTVCACAFHCIYLQQTDEIFKFFLEVACAQWIANRFPKVAVYYNMHTMHTSNPPMKIGDLYFVSLLLPYRKYGV